MLTKREADELQALAQIALPAVRTYRPLRTALPCEADRAALLAAVRYLLGHPLAGIDSPPAAVVYLARGGDPLP